MQRLAFKSLIVEGQNIPPASIDFGVGLTVISGASDTGKTYIANTVDFLLGGSAPPDNPQSRKYNRAILGVSAVASEFAIERHFQENFVQLYGCAINAITPQSIKKQLAATQKGNPAESLSTHLLGLVGLGGKQIRKNQWGEKSSLTLRQVAHLTVVSEEKIISKSSPVLTGEATTESLERSIFSFFLTGLDDAELTAIEKPKDKKARLDTEEAVIRSILEPKQQAYAKVMQNDCDAAGRLAKIESGIQSAAVLISATREQIVSFEDERKKVWTDLQKVKSRNLFIEEQLKRFALLEEFYNTDHQRLESIIEAGRAFETLPGGECAVCRSKPNDSNVTPTQDFLTACSRELAKLQSLAAELKTAIYDLVEEQKLNDATARALDKNLSELQEKIDSTLQPQSNRVSSGLAELIRLKTDVTRAFEIQQEIAELEKRIAGIEASRKQKVQKSTSVSSTGTAKAANFCQVVQEILVSWKYPLQGNVAFDPDPKKFDIVIGDQDRGSMGKGYRAITHAAFLIGLMRYCRKEGIPHPGFVLLDTPLNPFKGPDEGASGQVNDEVKMAFYESLAADTSGDQIIVLENIEPPSSILSKIRHHHFSKNTMSGRYGFFPV